MTTRSRRWWWTAIAATAVLLAGGGSEEEGGGAWAAVLTMGQVRQVVPGAASMDGWKEAGKPNAAEMDDLQRQWACLMKGRVGCEGSRYFSASAFEQEGTAARVDCLVIAYDDEQLADAAYDVLGDGHYRKRGAEGESNSTSVPSVTSATPDGVAQNTTASPPELSPRPGPARRCCGSLPAEIIKETSTEAASATSPSSWRSAPGRHKTATPPPPHSATERIHARAGVVPGPVRRAPQPFSLQPPPGSPASRR
ncbi:hypothetical protein OIE78_33720 [Streptomyces cellulosae]